MKNYKVKDIDSYIESADKEARQTLREMRRVIKASVPEAEEVISWGVPWFKYDGPIAGFAAYKNHVSFGPWVDVINANDRKVLEKAGYVVGKRTIQVGYDQKVPSEVITRIVKEQVKINKQKRKDK